MPGQQKRTSDTLLEPWGNKGPRKKHCPPRQRQKLAQDNTAAGNILDKVGSQKAAVGVDQSSAIEGAQSSGVYGVGALFIVRIGWYADDITSKFAPPNELQLFAAKGGSFNKDTRPACCLTCFMSKKQKTGQYGCGKPGAAFCLWRECDTQLTELARVGKCFNFTHHQAQAVAYGQWRRDKPALAEARDAVLKEAAQRARQTSNQDVKSPGDAPTAKVDRGRMARDLLSIAAEIGAWLDRAMADPETIAKAKANEMDHLAWAKIPQFSKLYKVDLRT